MIDARQLEEAQRRIEELEANVARLVSILSKDADELTRGQRAESQLAFLQAEVERLTRERDEERRARVDVEELFSRWLLQKAKRTLDRVPLVKGALKAVVKKIL